VQDSGDTAFVIFAVVMGMAAGASAGWMAVIGLVVVSLAAFAMRTREVVGPHPAEAGSYRLTLRVGLGTDLDALVKAAFAAHLSAFHLASMETTRHDTAVEASYDVVFLGSGSPQGLLAALNRSDGVCQIMVTHGLRDLSTGRDQQVEGIEHRAGALVVGGVPRQEVDALAGVVTLTDTEAAELVSWSSTADLDPRTRPPGSGKFLIKHSPTEPGIPVDVLLTPTELAWGGQNSNRAWRT